MQHISSSKGFCKDDQQVDLVSGQLQFYGHKTMQLMRRFVLNNLVIMQPVYALYQVNDANNILETCHFFGEFLKYRRANFE
ncbi:hypothetical protein CCR75_007316 [Bremia lactucae]|uniref:Uncharacterized protein n=1 Tax=Bremia lactucae TaxID=4779 RepID=A0A976FIA9_BRELC|nr:hypothetical protein CCR75_007316 [Bremia lactucae]